MGITLQHIADDLQLSKATVSRSLRNDPLILPRTRARVHETATRLGYEGRPRNSRRQSEQSETELERKPSKQKTLGLLFPASNIEQARHDINFVHIMQGIMTEAESAGLLLLVNTIQPDDRGSLSEQPTVVPAMIREGACQAVILRGAMHPADVSFLTAKLPVVSITQLYPGLPVDAVVPDNVDGIRNLVTRLAEQGHRCMAWVDGYYDASFLDGRQVGFIHGCLQNGLNINDQRFFGQEIYEGSRIRAVDKLLEAVEKGTTAMVCGNDAIALQVIEVLESHGVCVPSEVSVTGFDAVHLTAGGRRITSINPRFSEIGRAAVRLAIQRLTQITAPPYMLSVQSEMVVGDTIAAARPR